MPSTAQLSTNAENVHALRAAAAQVERSLARALEPFGLTPAQHELLHVIRRLGNEGAGCSELARYLAAPGPDITRLLDRLDTAGLVSRKRDVKDRRVVRPALTEKAEQLLADAAGPVAAAEQKAFHGLAPDDQSLLGTLLQGIRRNCPTG